MNYSVSAGHKSDYVVVNSGDSLVQLIENGPESIHWLIVREGSVEQRIALNFSTLLLLCKAVSLHPFFEKLEK